MTPPGESAAQIEKWIAFLCSPDAEDRAAGAAALYRAATSLFQGATSSWMKDAEFRALVCSPHIASAGKESSHASFIAGIAVAPSTFERMRTANGSPRLADVPTDQDAKEFELAIGGGYFDILTTREPGGPGAIAKFLQKFGEGIQQIEVYVSDVDLATQILEKKYGLPPIYPQTRAGADGTRVNFFLTQAAAGRRVLIEVVEES